MIAKAIIKILIPKTPKNDKNLSFSILFANPKGNNNNEQINTINVRVV